METIKTIKSAKSAGAACGAAAEAALGDTLTARVLAALRTMPQSKAVQLCAAFWEGFDASAPTIRGLKRIRVTKSESLRIARGIDAGLQPVDSWSDSVKAAPKAEKGRGAGGGRKPRPASLPAGGKGAPAPALSARQAGKPGKPDPDPTPTPLAPLAAVRQSVAQLVALCHNFKSKLPTDFLMAVDDLAELAKNQLTG